MTVPPGSAIGIVGGGQLGRMLAMAALKLGYRCHVYAEEADAPAAALAESVRIGMFADDHALGRFAGEVDVLTYEFENVPVDPLSAAAARTPLFPPLAALAIAQDRFAEKQFVAEQGGRPVPYAAVDDRAGFGAALARLGTPAILKTRRFGYDGKGQVKIAGAAEADAAWEAMGGPLRLLEAHIAFDAEFSILLCRGRDGEIVVWDAPVNRHEDGILATSRVPAGPELAKAIAEGEALARRVAAALDYVGVLALEFFARGEEALFNEMAPRVHNSGHWTIEGATTSQFENHIRAICGLPLGATDRTAPAVEMTNLIGDQAVGWREILADPSARLHLYGKGEPRPGRKMGHVTRLLGRT